MLLWIGDSAGNRSSLNCFVHEMKSDGSLVCDDHETRCGVCLEIAAKYVLDYSKGIPIKEIRDSIMIRIKRGMENQLRHQNCDDKKSNR